MDNAKLEQHNPFNYVVTSVFHCNR